MTRVKQFLFATVLLALVLPSGAADQRVTLTITITNLPVTSNTLVFTAPAAKTITWTNTAGSANVITGATVAASVTNLYLQLVSYGIGVPRLTPIASSLTTSNFQFIGEVNQNIAVSATGTGSGNWCVLTLSTTTVTRLTTVRVPIASEIGDTNRTNVGSLLVAGISDFSTTAFATNARALTNFLALGTPYHGNITQRVWKSVRFDSIAGPSTNAGAVYGGVYETVHLTNVQSLVGTATTLTNGSYYAPTVIGGSITGAVFSGRMETFTNGYWTNGIAHNLISSNLINYGNAFRSEGSGAKSTQIGSNATATGTSAIAIGPDTTASAQNGIAIGFFSSATSESGGIAIGSEAVSSGYADTSIGSESSATGGNAVAIGAGAAAVGTNSTAIGVSASIAGPNSIGIGQATSVGLTHTNSVAIGKSAATTTDGQIMLGSADVHLVQSAGRIQAGSLTNSVMTGTNRVDGDWSWTPVAVSSLANGNNIAVPGTNVVIEGSGPTAAFAINGVSGGRAGRVVRFLNRAQATLTVANESGVDPTAANRIWTPGYTDITVQSNGWVELVYNGTDSRWRVANAYPPVAVSTNSLAAGSTREVQYNSGGIFDGASGVVIDGETNLTVSGNVTNAQRAVFSARTASSILRTDSNKALAEVTVGSGLSFDGTTLSASGSSSSTNFHGIVVTNETKLMGNTIATNILNGGHYTGHGYITNSQPLVIMADVDATNVFGRVRMDSRVTDTAYFSHFDLTANNDYALRQLASGPTYVNAPSGDEVNLAIAGTIQWQLDNSGDLIAFADDTDYIGLVGANRPKGINVGTHGITSAAPYSISGDVSLYRDTARSAVIGTGGGSGLGALTATNLNIAYQIRATNSIFSSQTVQGLTVQGTAQVIAMGTLIEEVSAEELIADDQEVSVSKSFIALSSDSGTAANRTFVLSDPAVNDGQRLTLLWEDTDAGELLDTGNVRLSAAWTPTQDDTLSLITRNGVWYETGRSTN